MPQLPIAIERPGMTLGGMPFTQLALGAPIPDRIHAVSCSLPTMAAVRGYEEKDPEITRHLATGYPRFVVHPLAARLGAELSRRRGLDGRTLWLASSARMAADLIRHLGTHGIPAESFSEAGVHGVVHAPDPQVHARAKQYLQHVGGFLSSRQAEDTLHRLGAGPAPAAEALFPGDAAARVRSEMLPAFAGAQERDLIIANCGMNAVHAAFAAVNAVQAPRGRTAWVQLGWLYLDTIAILRKFTAAPGDYIHVSRVTDLSELRAVLLRDGGRIAGVMAEVPTNPLVQTPDVEELSRLCRAHGVHLVIDPSLVSAFSVDCLRHADLVSNSLTKYTGSEGDVIAGLVAVNPAGPDAGALRAAAALAVEPPYARDLQRLAAQVGSARAVVSGAQANAARVASFLSSHPAVASVHWALEERSRESYLRIARTPESIGGVLSFSLRGRLDAFYDRLRLPKGPSFGMRTTLICPFMYLAHYDLVNSDEGRAQLRSHGIEPDLLRLSVGTEPISDILGSLDEALGG